MHRQVFLGILGVGDLQSDEKDDQPAINAGGVTSPLSFKYEVSALKGLEPTTLLL